MVSIQANRRRRRCCHISTKRLVQSILLSCVVLLVFVVRFNQRKPKQQRGDAAQDAKLAALAKEEQTTAKLIRSQTTTSTAAAIDWKKTIRQDSSAKQFDGLMRSEAKNTTTTTTLLANGPKAIVAYVWTLTSCNDVQSSTEGLLDAALVLRYSVERISHPHSNSRYGHHMYVLVHPEATGCTRLLEHAGYTVLVKEPPVRASEIRSVHLRETVDQDGCCGSKEFVKLYAYDLAPHEIAVHVDADTAFLRPLDPLFDAMLESPHSPTRLQAQQQIVKQYPATPFPTRIEAYITRDYQQVIPGDNATLFQAGFMVVRRNPAALQELREIVLEGNYVEGWGGTSGWGGRGYAGKVGSKGMQGLIAYYYDYVRPHAAVELHGCRYNWMGGDVLYRSPPAFHPHRCRDKIGKCRNGREECEDCQDTPLSLIQSVHFTNCRKPWNCIGAKRRKGLGRKHQGIDERNTNYTKCMEVTQQCAFLLLQRRCERNGGGRRRKEGARRANVCRNQVTVVRCGSQSSLSH